MVQNTLVLDETKLVQDLVDGGIRGAFLHETMNGVKREFLEEFETSFEDAYETAFRDAFAETIGDCKADITGAEFSCNIPCEKPEWCCEPLEEGVLQCPFICTFTKAGISVFEVGGAMAYEIN